MLSTQDLVVWRRLHLEIDTMQGPPAGEQFTEGFEPRTLGNGTLAWADWTLTRTHLRRAFVELAPHLFDPYNVNSVLPWTRTVGARRLANQPPAEHWPAVFEEAAADSVADLRSAPEAWAVQFLTGYRHFDLDAQGNNHYGTAGNAAVYENPNRAVVWNYQYGMKLFHNNTGPNPTFKKVAFEGYVPRVSYHESVHLFGGSHSVQGTGDGVMNYSTLVTDYLTPSATDTAIELTAGQLPIVFASGQPGDVLGGGG